MLESAYPFIAQFFTIYVPLLFSLCVHEWAHAKVAYMKGDTLASDMGRLSLNPLVHADIIGTVFLPILSIFTGLPVFGWAKPVPVNAGALKQPVKDMFWIAFAGPLSNFCLSLAGTFLLIPLYFLSSVFAGVSLSVLTGTVEVFIYINLLLGFFNLIPLHPLDGGKVLARFLPARWNWQLEQWESYSSIALIMLFIMGGFRYLALPAHLLSIQLIEVAAMVTGWFL